MVDTKILVMKGPIIVSTIYFMMWYYFLFFIQLKTKYKLQVLYKNRGEVFDRYFDQNEEMLAADRIVGNTQEQMVPFITGLWLFSIFISPSIATWLGGIYTFLRMLYPLLLGTRISKAQARRVAFVTIPCYLIIFFMFISLALKALL